MALQTWIVPISCCKTGNTQQCYSEARNLGPVYTELRSLVSQHAYYTPMKSTCVLYSNEGHLCDGPLDSMMGFDALVT